MDPGRFEDVYTPVDALLLLRPGLSIDFLLERTEDELLAIAKTAAAHDKARRPRK